MSAEKDSESPKFDISQEYGRGEFLFRLDSLKSGLSPQDSLFAGLGRIIAWAERHPEGTIFIWREGDDGNIYPYAIMDISVQLPQSPSA